MATIITLNENGDLSVEVWIGVTPNGASQEVDAGDGILVGEGSSATVALTRAVDELQGMVDALASRRNISAVNNFKRKDAVTA